MIEYDRIRVVKDVVTLYPMHFLKQPYQASSSDNKLVRKVRSG